MFFRLPLNRPGGILKEVVNRPIAIAAWVLMRSSVSATVSKASRESAALCRIVLHNLPFQREIFIQPFNTTWIAASLGSMLPP